MKVIDAQADPAALYVPFSRKFALPERFTAIVELDDPTLPLCYLEVVVENGRTVCEAVRFERRPGGPPVNGTVLRQIPIGECVGRAAGKLATLDVRSSDGRLFAIDSETGEEIPIASKPMGEGHVGLVVVGLDREFQREATAGERTPPTEVQEAADAYREAMATAEGRKAAPTMAVAKALNMSRSTAARRIAAAREAGLLGPALRAKGGER